jgi:hypothetical protein
VRGGRRGVSFIMSMPDTEASERSRREQIAINRARTPTERMLEMFRPLDAEYEAAKHDPAVRARIQRRLEDAERGRQECRAHFRRMMETGYADPIPPNLGAPERQSGSDAATPSQRAWHPA